MRYRVIDAEKARFPAERLCDVLGALSRSFYAWKTKPASSRQR